MRWVTPLRSLGPWWLVAAVAAGGLALIAFGPRLRLGGLVIAAALVLGAFLRSILPVPRGGGLEVRKRWLDVLTLLVLAALVFAAFFFVRTCAPASEQYGGGRAANCPAQDS